MLEFLHVNSLLRFSNSITYFRQWPLETTQVRGGSSCAALSRPASVPVIDPRPGNEPPALPVHQTPYVR